MKLNNKSGFVGTTIAALTAIGTAVTAGVAVGGAAALIGGGTLLAGGFALSKLGKQPSGPSLPALPAPTSSKQTSSQLSKSAELTAQKERLDTARRKRTGTVLTSPQGLLSQSETSTKSLLGG